MVNLDNNAINRFQEVLDLTQNESKVYFAILKNPDAEVQELAHYTELPRSRIYETMSKLAAKNLVEKDMMNGGYRLIPPIDAIQEQIAEEEHRSQMKREALNRMKTYLDDIWRHNIGEETDVGVRLIPGHSIEPFLLKDMKDLENRMLIAASSPNPIIDWRNATKQLTMKVRKALDVRYLVYDEKMATHLRDTLTSISDNMKKVVKVNYNEELYISFIIIDSISYLFIFTTDSLVEPMVLRSVSNSLTKSLAWMFDALWSENIISSD